MVNDESYGSRSTQSTLSGEPQLTTDGTVVTAHVGGNAEVFPQVLDLHVPEGSTIADVTYGKGVFWNRVPEGLFDVRGTDVDPEKSPTGESVDCRNLPYENGEVDTVVLDPPYAAGLLREESQAGEGSHSSFRSAYAADGGHDSTSKYHQAVLDLYCDAGDEARRVLADDGTLIVKVQDEVSANTQELTHIQITNYYETIGFDAKDLFVVVRPNTPAVSGVNEQEHARKNHSFFMVYEVAS